LDSSSTGTQEFTIYSRYRVSTEKVQGVRKNNVQGAPIEKVWSV